MTTTTVTREEVLQAHLGGKVGLALPRPVKTPRDLCLAYTPGVAVACNAIVADPAAASRLTSRASPAVVSECNK